MLEISNNIFSEISFYERFKNLSENFRSEKYLEKTDKDNVIKLFEELGFGARYNSKGQFYRTIHKLEGYTITLTISLKYGVCESIYAIFNDDKTVKVGGPSNTIFKRLEIQRGIKVNGYIKHPSFSNYSELKKILETCFDLYTDLIKILASKLHIS